MSAIFSGTEIAFISANKLKIELQHRQGSRIGKWLAMFQQNRYHFLGTTLIGNNIALVIFGILMVRVLEPWVSGNLPDILHTDIIILLIITVISTSIVLLIGEFLPKALFSINPNKILNILAFPMMIVYRLLYPIVSMIISMSIWFIKIVLKQETKEVELVFDRVDLKSIIQETNQEEEQADIDATLFQNALDLSEVKARECMVPRPEIKAVDIGSSVEDLLKLFTETGFSKILVYKDSIDNVEGYVHNFELLKNPQTIKEVLIPILVVPETMSGEELLAKFRKEQKSIALVVDEFGGTAGIIALEDVLEELFGEIEDEHDVQEFIEQQINPDEFIFSGRLEIDYLNEKYQIELPDDGEYETLAGFIVVIHESIPKANEVIRIGQFEFNILEVTDTRIDMVRLKIHATE